ncbi:MAG: hypothetical protein ACOX9A_15095 [Anaerolineae bacterium]|jgi:hypothetical protein
MDVCNREHAEICFPKRHWEIGTKALALADFAWDHETKRMLYAGWDIPFGKPAEPPPAMRPDSSVRLYRKDELRDILAERGMTLLATYSDYDGNPDTYKELQLVAYSHKMPF